MTSRDFCYWLQGYFELAGDGVSIDAAKTEMIKKHLAMVFKHEIDPSYGDKAHQDALSALHQGGAAGSQGKPRESDRPIRYKC